MAIPPQSSPPEEEEPFDVEEALGRVREAVRGLPQAALLKLAARGHPSPFELRAACVLSTCPLLPMCRQVGVHHPR